MLQRLAALTKLFPERAPNGRLIALEVSEKTR
jgi:hypothetical protein